MTMIKAAFIGLACNLAYAGLKVSQGDHDGAMMGFTAAIFWIGAIFLIDHLNAKDKQ